MLLGNLNDIYDSLPNVLDGMQPTTALFPPLQPPQTLQESGMNMNGYEAQLAKMFTTGGTNCDNVDIFGNYAKPSGGSELKAESYWTDFSQCQKYEKQQRQETYMTLRIIQHTRNIIQQRLG